MKYGKRKYFLTCIIQVNAKGNRQLQKVKTK